VAQVTVTHVPDTAYQTRVEAGALTFLADEPVASGGDGLGPAPYDLLLAALGHCTVLTILLYARRKEWQVDDVSIRASHERETIEELVEGALVRRKVERIELEISLGGDLDEAQRTRLMDIAGKCPVHRTLTGDLEISLTEVSAFEART
jgi:putative redox protein